MLGLFLCVGCTPRMSWLATPARPRPVTVYEHQRKRPRIDEPVGPDNDPYTSTGIMLARSRSMTRTMTKRRRQRRRRGRGRKGRAILTWPRYRLVKFRVVTTFNISSVGGVLNTRNIVSSSLADPHQSMGSNLPLGLDQWAAMYKKYVVVGARHFVKVHNVTSTGAVVYGLTLRQPDETADLASAEAYLEHQNTRSRMLSPDMDHSGLGIAYSAKRYWRVRKFMDAEQLHGGLSTTPTAPARMAYTTLWFQDVSTAGDYTVEGFVTTEYVALLFDPVTPSRSSL